MTSAEYRGGAPILGEGLALDLMNTYHAVRGKPAEGLGSPDDATAWVQQLAERLARAGAPAATAAHLADVDLDTLLTLRDAVRGIAGALVSAEVPDQHDVDAVNQAAARSPRWASLAWAHDGAASAVQTAAPPVDQVLGTLAADAINLFTGTDAARLRLCERPGCVLFFLKDHPRREWCTPACGARVRAARAYAKRSGRRDAVSSATSVR
ncbi:CGNR zinc finger domain-containing protein [Salinibacterium sp. ZJ454]|uniref:CGNR zinc finger domain-containing protein n=1 Tax=Salinibacterium sp. ZJ454 TaxID=2708339 RepID=UPI00141DED9A|nr:CGNR zinc finger domain-containing protein [Salinibacterium sp. ZJ454]